MDKLMIQLEEQKKEIKDEVIDTSKQVKILGKDADVDTHKMLDMVDKMDQKKY